MNNNRLLWLLTLYKNCGILLHLEIQSLTKYKHIAKYRYHMRGQPSACSEGTGSVPVEWQTHLVNKDKRRGYTQQGWCINGPFGLVVTIKLTSGKRTNLCLFCLNTLPICKSTGFIYACCLNTKTKNMYILSFPNQIQNTNQARISTEESCFFADHLFSRKETFEA